MITYAVIFNNTGKRQKEGYSYWGTLISRHYKFERAKQAFRKRNRWLFDKNYARRVGMLHNGTFDEIVMLDSDIVQAMDFERIDYA